MIVPPEAITSAREQQSRRSSLKTPASRRGQLKISSPFPTTVVEDDEEQSRLPLSSCSMASLQNALDPLVHGETSRGQVPAVEAAGAESAARSTRSQDISRVHYKGLSMPMRISSQMQRFNLPREPVLSSASDTLAAATSSQIRMDLKKQRKNGSLRTVLSKVFGRKAKQEASKQSIPSRHGYHRSVRAKQSHLDDDIDLTIYRNLTFFLPQPPRGMWITASGHPPHSSASSPCLTPTLPTLRQ